jgi:hypothetical protein
MQPSYAQESAGFEKIRDVSPDGKFAVRISCSSELEDPSNIDSSLITGVELVSLPSRKVVVNIGQDDADSAPHLTWSSDSEWFAFPLSEGHRVTSTAVYHCSGDNFTRFETEELRSKFSGPHGAWGEVLRGTHGLTPDKLEGYLKMRVQQYSKASTGCRRIRTSND